MVFQITPLATPDIDHGIRISALAISLPLNSSFNRRASGIEIKKIKMIDNTAKLTVLNRIVGIYGSKIALM